MDVVPLEGFAGEVERYYRELAEHVESAADDADPYPADRIYV